MTSCARQYGYSLLVVILIVAVIAMLGMVGAQKIFDKGSQVPDRSLVHIARLLLEYEADVNALNSKSITPLHLAAGNGHFEMVQLLIYYDADLSPKNVDGHRPLTMAMQGFAATDSADKDTRKRYEKTIDLLRSWGAKS